MRSLYESMLDSKENAIERVKNSKFDVLRDFLGITDNDKYYKWSIKDNKLYVERKPSAIDIICFNKMENQQIYRRSPEKTIDPKLLKYVYFNDCSLKLRGVKYSEEDINFLSNCSNCLIELYDNTDLEDIEKVLKNTKGNSIKVEGDEYTNYFYSFDELCDLNLPNVEVILNHSAALNSIKNLTCKSLVLQRGSKWKFTDKHSLDSMIWDDGSHSETTDYFSKELDKFLDRNKITSIGVVDTYIQYMDWFVKEGNTYKIKFLKSDSKRIPKVR